MSRQVPVKPLTVGSSCFLLQISFICMEWLSKSKPTHPVSTQETYIINFSSSGCIQVHPTIQYPRRLWARGGEHAGQATSLSQSRVQTDKQTRSHLLYTQCLGCGMKHSARREAAEEQGEHAVPRHKGTWTTPGPGDMSPPQLDNSNISVQMYFIFFAHRLFECHELQPKLRTTRPHRASDSLQFYSEISKCR